MDQGHERAELAMADQSQLAALQAFLRREVPDVQVSRVSGQAGAGDLGALDLLALLASSSGLVTAIKVLPDFLRSRRTGLSISMTVRGEPFTTTATNIDEVMPILDRLLDA